MTSRLSQNHSNCLCQKSRGCLRKFQSDLTEKRRETGVGGGFSEAIEKRRDSPRVERVLLENWGPWGNPPGGPPCKRDPLTQTPQSCSGFQIRFSVLQVHLLLEAVSSGCISLKS